MAHRPRTHVTMARETYDLLFDDARRARLGRIAWARQPVFLPDLRDPAAAACLAEVETLVTSWGAAALDAEVLDLMPRLRAVFHAAGTVRDIATPALWERGIVVTTAADHNAIPVAEYTFAAIILATKRAFFHVRRASHGPESWRAHAGRAGYGALGRTIGVVGFSRTGRRVVERLRQLEGARILVADPFADADAVRAAGAELVTLADLLPSVDVLTLHAPELPSTRHMIGARELAALPDGAVLINTARGALVDHDALARACAAGRIDAVLDVTDPEPLPTSSPLLALDNVAVTPHLAGSLGGETRRLADAALDELEAYAAGLPPRHPVRASDMAVGA
ncbi:hydroxyacid dehydrogenase [Microbacterium excoecariae]|uniref:hydroxyacid dehydrogenase n=1 Tax=Microbacterium excoecariae TaxID=2715210 RepID=UPI001407360A|nr:hydroxyacid dehydrogenase [Microbacterium excoecariae]NHI16599.1 hydroxyacid dehydrogenase [Microbacterium excoecariae]